MKETRFLEGFIENAREFFGDSAIIGGGAPRDAIHGKPIKDIDIFVKIDDSDNGHKQFVSNCELFAGAIDGKLTWRETEPGYTDHFNLADIEVDPDLFDNGVVKIEVIALYIDPANDVHAYDFGLSQVFVTPDGPFFSEKYAYDASDRTISYYHDIGRSEAAHYRSKARLARLRAKYPDWAFSGTELVS